MAALVSSQAEVAQNTRIQADRGATVHKRLATGAHLADFRGPRDNLWPVGFLAEVVDHQVAEDPQVQMTRGLLAAAIRLPIDSTLQETRGTQTITHLG